MKTTFVLNSAVLASVALAVDYGTYPQVPKSYTINGFADPVYDNLPSCAKSCVTMKNPTVCPDFDSGCFCVMPNWNGLVASCLVDSCNGGDVKQASEVIVSMCNRVGANTWALPPALSTSISSAINVKDVEATTTPDATSSAEATTTPAAESSAPATTPVTSAAPSTEETSAPVTSAASSAPVSSAEKSEASSAANSSAAGNSSSGQASATSHSVEQSNNAAKTAIGAIGFVAALPLLI
jgi:hypothetical protein